MRTLYTSCRKNTNDATFLFNMYANKQLCCKDVVIWFLIKDTSISINLPHDLENGQ